MDFKDVARKISFFLREKDTEIVCTEKTISKVHSRKRVFVRTENLWAALFLKQDFESQQLIEFTNKYIATCT